MLETVRERLARALPQDAVAGRLAGDEFAIFAEGVEDEPARLHHGRDLARMVLAEIAKPLHLPGQEIDVTASIGVALVPEHARQRDRPDPQRRRGDVPRQAARAGTARCSTCRR